jgi:DNA-directed RNA polymerase specialized sigma subunit
LRHHGNVYDHEELTDEVPEIIIQYDNEPVEEYLLLSEVTPTTLENIATEKWLVRAISMLERTEKEVLYHLYIEEHTVKETALLMDCTVQWVYRLKSKAIRKLRWALESKEDSNGQF